MSSWEKLQSETIDVVRLPLAIMVLFIHMNPCVINLIDADFDLLSGQGIYNVTAIFFSHVLSAIAVPAFFLISGYLFFMNFKEWSWARYLQKMKSRVRTLIIPYVLWNAVPFVLTLIYLAVGRGDADNSAFTQFLERANWHVLYDYHEINTYHLDWSVYDFRVTLPYNMPLWFLRDLIKVTILTPVCYFAIKKLGIIIIAILFFDYVSRACNIVPDITVMLFFVTGAYIALKSYNIVQLAHKYKFLIIALTLVSLIVATIYDGSGKIGFIVYHLFIFIGVFTAFYVVSGCIQKFNIRPNKLLVSSCFFIYAFHLIDFPIIGTPLSFVTTCLHKLIPGSCGLEEGICYLASPFIMAILCVLIFAVSKRLLPKTTSLFTGNR